MQRKKRRSQNRRVFKGPEVLESRELKTVVSPEAGRTDLDVGGTIAGAHVVKQDLSEQVVLTGLMNREGSDVDLYEVRLRGGDDLNVSRRHLTSSRQIRPVAYDEFGIALESRHTPEGWSFSVPADGSYYLGVSRESNYDITSPADDITPINMEAGSGWWNILKNHYSFKISTMAADAGDSPEGAHDVRAQPMLKQTVHGWVSSSDSDLYRVSANEGDFLAVTSSSGTQTKIYDSTGETVLASGRSAVGLRVPVTGDYYVEESTLNSPWTPRFASYDTTIQVVAEADDVSSRMMNASRESSAGLTTWLDGDTLHLVGPTGYGFEIESDHWSVEHHGEDAGAYSVYSASHSIDIESLLPGFDIPLMGTEFQITTAPGQFGHIFGTVENVDVTLAGISMEQIGMFSGGFGSQIIDSLDGVNPLSRTPGITMGIDLGSELDHLGLPLSDNVPYFYFGAEGSPEIKTGDISFETGKRGGSIAVDPLDSFFLSLPDLNDFAMGVSVGGNIEYQPLNRPEQYDNDLYGHIYGKGSFKFYEVFKAEGDAVLDLDANDDGLILGTLDPAQLIRGDLDAVNQQQLDSLFALESDAFNNMLDDLAVGVNGKVSVAVEKSGIGMSVPVGTGSIIADATDGIYFHGGTVNPFEGVPILEKFGNPNNEMEVGGHYRGTDDFSLRAAGKMAVGPFDAANGHILVSNHGITAEAKFDLLGVEAEVRGVVHQHGFHLEGSAGVDWGVIEARANFELSYVSTPARTKTVSMWGRTLEFPVPARDEFAFTADVQATLDLEHGGFGLTGELSGQVSFTAGSTGIEISGAGSVRGDIHLGFFSVGAGAGFGFNNDGLTIDLPIIPDLTVSW